MKIVSVISQMSLLLLVVAGCGPAVSSKNDNSLRQLAGYGPAKIDIMPLTEFAGVEDGRPSKINVYISLLDSFDCQIKTPAVFRFELYDKVPRSAQPKGRRIILWPDIDLNDAAANNKHWKDFLKTYEFNLPFRPEGGKSYILQVTSICPDGKRLSAEVTLK